MDTKGKTTCMTQQQRKFAGWSQENLEEHLCKMKELGTEEKKCLENEIICRGQIQIGIGKTEIFT